MKPLRLGDRPRPQHGAHRQRGDAHLDPAAAGLALVQADPGERRVGEQAEGDEPVARGATPAGQIVPDDPKVVEGDVGELGAAGALAHRPDIGRRGLQAVVDGDIATRVDLDAGHVQTDPCRIRRAARRHQEVAAVEGLLAVRRAHAEAHTLARPTLHPEGLGRQQDLDPFGPEHLEDRVGDVGVLTAGELRAALDDGDVAPEATVRLRELKAHIAAPEHDEVRGEAVELQHLDVRERLGGGQARDLGNGGVRADIQKHAIARQPSGAAVV